MRPFRGALIALAVWAGCVAGVAAEEPMPVAAADALTPEMLATRRQEAEASTALDEATRKRVVELYQRASDELVAAAAAHERLLEHEQAIAGAPDEQQKLRQELDQAAPEAKAAIDGDSSLADVEQLLETRETELARLRAQLVAQEAEPQRRADQRVASTKLLESLAAQLVEVEHELAAPLTDEVHPEVFAAAKALATARKDSLTAQQRELEAELRRYNATNANLPLRRDLAARRASQAAQEVQALQELLNEKRREDADRQAKLARQNAAKAHPAVRRIAEENALLAERRTGADGLASRIEATLRAQDAVRGQLKKLETAFSDVKEKVDLVGLTDANGAVLRKQRQLLPALHEHQAAVRARQVLIGNVQLQRLDLESQREQLSDIDSQVEAVVGMFGADVDELSRGAIQFAARELLVAQRDALDALLKDNSTYFEELVPLQDLEEKLISETLAFRDYIDERVLWIRSADVVGHGTATDALKAANWFADPQKWNSVGEQLWHDVRRNLPLHLGAIAIFALVYRAGRRLRDRLRSAGELVGKSHVTAFHPTVLSLLLTFLISIQWPALLWYLSWRFEHAADAGEFDRACAAGLQFTALLYLTMEFFRQVCRRHGLADAHFNWPRTGLSIISRNMRWLMLVLLPVAFIVSALEYVDQAPQQHSLGRISLMVGLAALAIFMHRLLRPRRGALAETYARNPIRWSTRLQKLWHGLGVGVPLALAALAASGYLYTALQLTWRLQATIWLIVGLLLLTSLFVRWVHVARRAMAIRQAMERRAANASGKSDAPTMAAGDLTSASAASLDLSFLSQQARRLLQSAIGMTALIGVWLIWVDVLPALRVLNNVEVWKASGEVVNLGATSPVTPNAQGTIAAQAAVPATLNARGTIDAQAASPDDISVTLADLLVAIMIASMAVIAAKNLPGLLEFTVLQRLPVESGAKFAIKTVASYLISVIGIVWTLKTLGVAWMHVQWLIAAISVGLGFGLQEIFGNFVSGLIILFERPVRVGDIVTVGQVTGCITRIQIRATTISDADRRELIVPNKDFITGQIVNWTLSDPITRVVVPVGIAYDANAELAHALLLQIARENPWVMKDPEPMVVMIGLGESSLNFELRVFIATRDQHPALVHSLNTTIAKRCQEQGIEIAYPQRDIHIRSINGLPIAAGNEIAMPKRQDKSAA